MMRFSMIKVAENPTNSRVQCPTTFDFESVLVVSLTLVEVN